MASPYVPIDELLSKRNLEAADDFPKIVNLAWLAQQHRSRNGNSRLPVGENVSRTSLLFACVELAPEIQDLLKQAGLSYEAFREESGLVDFEREQRKEVDTIPVSSRMDDGLQEYSKTCPDCPKIGACELAYAIAVVGGDTLERRFASPDGDLRKAADLILERLQNKDAAARLAETIDLTPFNLEKHVDNAFRVALALAGEQPINAGQLLKAAIAVGQTTTSTAFVQLAEMLTLTPVAMKPAASANMSALPVSEQVKKSFSVAAPFLEKESVWGRDYVTLALLAADDPSLLEIELETDKKLGEVRDDWFNFLVADAGHRTLDSWTAWWRAAGMTPPSGASTEPPSSSGHRTLLLTWNPGSFAFSRFASFAEEVEKTGAATMGWSSGNRTHVSIDDRVFLMRQGEEPKGIVGSGWVAGEVRQAPHFDDKRSEQGDKYNRIEVRWDALGEFPIVSREELQRIAPGANWDSAAGGIEIDEDVVPRLEAAFQQTLARAGKASPPELSPLAFLDTDSIPPQAGTRDFKPSEHDSLDVDAQAKIFSALLIAREVQPPFALGLFGDWGVGKTFFMRLMQEHVEEVAGQHAATERGIESVARAAQIEFNAWHYVDSDLWASLASHIFDGLSKELSPSKQEKEVEKVRRELRQLIDSSQREKKEAEAAIETAQVSRQKASLELDSKQRARQRDAKEFQTLRLQRVWKAVLQAPKLEGLKNEAERAAKRFGVDEVIDSVGKARQVYDSLRNVSQRTAGLAAAFVQEFQGPRLVLSISLLLGLMALIVVWPMLLSLAGDQPSEFVTMLLTPLLRLGTIVGPAALWALTRIQELSKALADLEQINEEIRDPRVPLEKPSEEEIDLQARIERLDAEIATEQRQIEEADRQIAAAQAEIQRIDSGGLVYDFLEGRVRDSRYLDRLGLISVIRRDFEELGALLRDWRKHGAGDAVGPSQASAKPPPIERIILYIDDLDRCPPKRVVEVLQAVHLILAFDLFVVVVAVDARWLERSLNEVYNVWPKALNEAPVQGPFHRFSAHNYLEKIFQIPYSLPMMDEDGYQKLVKDMIRAPQRRAETAQQRLENQLIAGRSRPTEKDLSAGEPAGPDSHGEATPVEPKPAEAEKEAPSEEEKQRLRDEGREQEEQKLAERAKQEEERRQREQEAADERIKAMLLNSSEQAFISSLHCFIETPRLAKRFVNIYRLIRVRASEGEGAFKTFIDPDQGEYRAVLMLLAICVGRADIAPALISALHDATDKKFRTWLKNESPYAEVEGDVGKVVAALKEGKGPAFEERLAPYRTWAREVGRYSFHWRLNAED